jgi:hypothetical protein
LLPLEKNLYYLSQFCFPKNPKKRKKENDSKKERPHKNPQANTQIYRYIQVMNNVWFEAPENNPDNNKKCPR